MDEGGGKRRRVSQSGAYSSSSDVERGRYDDAPGPPADADAAARQQPPRPTAADVEADREKSERMRALKASIMSDDLASSAAGPTAAEAQALTLNDAGMTEEDKMAALMGFGGFGSTKNSKVEDNHTGAAKGASQRKKERKYRQYMNRKGGFNRPLDKMK